MFTVLQSVRALQPRGPYRLCGYSFGACVALEMALQLVTSGEVVDRLFLLDGSHRFVAAHTVGHKDKFGEDKMAEGETEAMCAFLLQFIRIDYMQVRIAGNCTRILCTRATLYLVTVLCP